MIFFEVWKSNLQPLHFSFNMMYSASDILSLNVGKVYRYINNDSFICILVLMTYNVIYGHSLLNCAQKTKVYLYSSAVTNKYLKQREELTLLTNILSRGVDIFYPAQAISTMVHTNQATN